LGLLPLGIAALAQTALAQTVLAQNPPPRPPGEVPYLAFPPVTLPGAPPQTVPTAPTVTAPATPPGAPLELRPSTSPAATPANPPAKDSPGLDALKQRDQELATVRADQKRLQENEAKLRREIEAIGDDRRKLNQQLIDAAGRVRAMEDAIAQTEERLRPLDDREKGLQRSLDGRRGMIIEVLAALQRIGRHPPPALMVRPEDALQSLRSAILLGAVLPEMRQEMDALVADLGELVKLRKDIAEERVRLDRDLKGLAEESPRLALLIEQRQRQQTEIERSLAGERQRAAGLGRQAESLQELIAKLEQNLDPDGRAARGLTRPGDEKKSVDGRRDLAALKDPGRLTPAIAFATAKKQLPLPVNGVRIREYGTSDGVGGTEKGLSIASRPGTQVTAPCDGWVVYAGPFRNYGQLLILNAGGGYHVLLAGMERISVDLGQFVVTGEPVAVMGSRVQAAASVVAGSGQPVLYVEFRKDGTPVDPSPWWAASEVEKVRG
jgi:septal ring factor EnvC (AmiA/AmiB activator)